MRIETENDFDALYLNCYKSLCLYASRYMRVVITDSSNKNATRDTAAIAEIYAYEIEN